MKQLARPVVDPAKIGRSDKLLAAKKLSQLAQQAQQNFIPHDKLDEIIRKENVDSYKYRGRSARDYAKAGN